MSQQELAEAVNAGAVRAARVLVKQLDVTKPTELRGYLQNGADVLAFTPIGSITGLFNSGTGTLTLTGTAPKKRLAPSYVEYSDNLFTLLGDAYQVTAYESMCAVSGNRRAFTSRPRISWGGGSPSSAGTASPVR